MARTGSRRNTRTARPDDDAAMKRRAPEPHAWTRRALAGVPGLVLAACLGAGGVAGLASSVNDALADDAADATVHAAIGTTSPTRERAAPTTGPVRQAASEPAEQDPAEAKTRDAAEPTSGEDAVGDEDADGGNAPAKQAAPSREKAPAKRAAPAKQNASAKRAAPAKRTVRHYAGTRTPVYRSERHPASSSRKVRAGGSVRIVRSKCPVCGKEHASGFTRSVVDHYEIAPCPTCGKVHDHDFEE